MRLERKEDNIATEGEERAREKLKSLLNRRQVMRKSALQSVALKAPDCASTAVPDSMDADETFDMESVVKTPDCASTLVPDSMDADETFDMESVALAQVSQITHKKNYFLAPDEDAVFLDTQGMLRSGLDTRLMHVTSP